MTQICKHSIKIHCDAIGCRECIIVSSMSEATEKGWTNIEDHDYCPTHSKMIEINWCPYCYEDIIIMSDDTTDSFYALCTCCKMRGPSEASIVDAVIVWNNFCQRIK